VGLELTEIPGWTEVLGQLGFWDSGVLGLTAELRDMLQTGLTLPMSLII
jgi:hypothetical protein